MEEELIRKIQSTLKSLQFVVNPVVRQQRLEDLTQDFFSLFKNSDWFFRDFWKDKTITQQINTEGNLAFSLNGSPLHYCTNFFVFNYREQKYMIGNTCPLQLKKIVRRVMSDMGYKETSKN